MALDWQGVSSRITGLLKVGDTSDVARVADRLGVRQYQLEETIARSSRLSTLKVAAAIVRLHGIDPTWLMTGNYDAVTYKIGQRRNASEIDLLLKRLVCES